MAEKFVSRRNVKFLLHEVFKVEELCRYDFFKDHNRDTFDMMVDTIFKIGTNSMYPYFKDMELNPPRYVNGMVEVHPRVKAIMKELGEGGWINPSMAYEHNGQQIPFLVNMALDYIMAAANYAMLVYAQLTEGAAKLILTFADQALQDVYLKNMFAGQWQGTMVLTEPDAGSSLADIKTQAEPADAGYYKIKGKKIFISAGDTDAVENTVHLMLARIKGAPAGVKGISLFVVPKYRPDGQGGWQFDDVNCEGIEKKLGYKGCPICQLSMGDNNDCRGYLVGKANQGLSYMFLMMNMWISLKIK